MRYQKIQSKIWNDEKFLKLSDDARLLFFYIMTSPHSNSIGLYVLPKPYICCDLEWSAQRLAKPFEELLAQQIIIYDEPSRIVCIVNHLKHNPIENQNQAIAATKNLADLPKSLIFSVILEQLAKPFHKQLIERLRELIPEPETETETETEEEKELVATETALRLSSFLFSFIKKRNNGHKQPDFKKWGIEVDRMIKIDARDPTEIERVIVWCQGDEFWQNNILSTLKLRKHFDKLVLKMNNGKKDTWDEIKEWARERDRENGIHGTSDGTH